MAYWAGPPSKREDEEEEEPLFFLPNLDELTNDPVPFPPSMTSLATNNNNNIWGAPIVLQTKNELTSQKKKVAIEWTRIVHELKISAHLPAILEALEACNAQGIPIQQLDIVEFSFALAETDCPENVRRILIRKLNSSQLPKDESVLINDQTSSAMNEKSEETIHEEYSRDDQQGVGNSSITREVDAIKLVNNNPSDKTNIEIEKAKEGLTPAEQQQDLLAQSAIEKNLDEDDVAGKLATASQVESRLQAHASEGSRSESAGSGSTDATSISPDFGASSSLVIDHDAWNDSKLKEDDLRFPKYSIDSTDSMAQSEEQGEVPHPPPIAPTKLRSDSVESQQHTQSDSDTSSLEEEKKVNRLVSDQDVSSNLMTNKGLLKKASSNEKRHEKWDKGKKKRKKKRSVVHVAEETPLTQSNIESDNQKSAPPVEVTEEDGKVLLILATSRIHYRQIYDQMVKLFHRTKTSLFEVHQLALSSDREVKWIFGFIFCFPEIVEWTIGHYAPSWASVCLFYAFLIQILCVDSGGRREWKTSISRRVIPLAFLLDGVSHPSLLLGFDRYELLITATLISAIKIVHSLNPIVVLGMGFQVLFPLVARDLVCHSNMCHSLMLYIQALMGLCCLVVAKGEH